MVEVMFEIDERNQFKILRQFLNFLRIDQFNIKSNFVQIVYFLDLCIYKKMFVYGNSLLNICINVDIKYRFNV